MYIFLETKVNSIRKVIYLEDSKEYIFLLTL